VFDARAPPPREIVAEWEARQCNRIVVSSSSICCTRDRARAHRAGSSRVCDMRAFRGFGRPPKPHHGKTAATPYGWEALAMGARGGESRRHRAVEQGRVGNNDDANDTAQIFWATAGLILELLI
jgi:hypothetical protein